MTTTDLAKLPTSRPALFDLVVDLIGGDELVHAIEATKEGGTVLAIADGATPPLRQLAQRRDVRLLEPLVEPDGEGVGRLLELVRAGSLRVPVAATSRLEAGADAYRRQERGGLRGKLVLTHALG